MQRSTFILAVMGCYALLASSCQKIDLLTFDLKSPETKKAAACNLSRIIYEDAYTPGVKDTLDFSYDAAGVLQEISRKYPRTGAPGYRFLYKNGVLTDYIGYYSNEYTEFWHRYFYSGNAIRTDSVYVFARNVNNRPVDAFYRYASELHYDKKGRVDMETITYEGLSPEKSYYAYNGKGNLNNRSYDNRVNFLQTDLLLAFISRDFSVNNPFNALIYSKEHLPVAANFADSPDFNFLGNYFRNATFQYNCPDKKK